MKNIIILTSGLSGSSVVTQLISKAGYWTGDTVCKKLYNTHENKELVHLNKMLMGEVDYYQDYFYIVKPEMLDLVEDLFNKIDLTPFKNFIKKCEQNGPWLWKDPRLWVTFRFWNKLLNLSKIQFLFVDRSITQRWISELLKRNIQTLAFCREYSQSIEFLIKNHLNQKELRYCEVLFDNLIERPDETLVKLNDSLKLNLSLEDLKDVYHLNLYEKPRGWKDLIMAIIIYLKNYRLRNKFKTRASMS